MTPSIAPTVHPFADAVQAYAWRRGGCASCRRRRRRSRRRRSVSPARTDATEPLQLAHWLSSHGNWSVALRVPNGVIGIDVDAYEKASKTKHGDVTLAAAAEL